MAVSAWYHELLATLRQIPTKDPDASSASEVIDIGDKITGVYQHKLRHWFGPDTTLIKVPVPTTEEGAIDYEELDFDPKCVTALWTKPGSESIYVLDVDGVYGNFKENFEKLGLIAEPGPKLFKRLKRAFGVLTVGSAQDFNYRIITDPKLAPEKLTDGMAWARSSFISKVARRPVTQGDVFQYSTLTKEGLAKGSLVAMDHLEKDVVIPGLHNIKTELRSTSDKKLFCIEGFEDPKIARTDLQTMINCGLYDLFERQFLAEMNYLVELAADPEFLAKVFWEEFESKDYFGKAWKHYLRAKDNNAKAKQPNLEQKPRLTLAHEMGVDPRVSPTLMRDFIKWSCSRVNIRKLQVPIDASCAGYIIPDLSQFDQVTGDFKPNPAVVLRHNQISFPKDFMDDGPVAVVRQPNGLGEVLITNNVRAHYKSNGVQISPLACDPELGKVYGLPTLERSCLEVWGGADMDDRVLGLSDANSVTQIHKRLQELQRLDLPPSNLEALVDQSQQSSKAPWTIRGQLYAALLTQEMELGAAVNFLMALTLVEDWEFYRFAAESSELQELASAQEHYLGQDKPRYPDCWLPIEVDEYDPYARLPIEEFGDEETQFSYPEVEEVETECGRLMAKCGEIMDDYVSSVFEHKDIDQGAFINSIEGTQFLRKCLKEGKEGVRIGLALWAMYLKFTGREPDYKGSYESLVSSYEVMPFDTDITIADKQREFGVVTNQLFAGRNDAEKLAATAQFALKLLAVQEKRWHGPKDRRRPLFNAYGNDSWLFIPLRNEDYSLLMDEPDKMTPGLQHYWIFILKGFADQCEL